MEEGGRKGGGGGRERKIGVPLEDLSITGDQHAGQWLTWDHRWHVIPTPNWEYMPALLLKVGKRMKRGVKTKQLLMVTSKHSSSCLPSALTVFLFGSLEKG